MSLKQKTIYGIIWSFAEAILLRSLTFLAMLLLARWLGPSDFGLIGMIAIFIGIGTSLVDSGMSSSIIRTKNANDSDFSTVFYMNLAMSLLVYLILFIMAPYIATFFKQEILINIIRVYCLIFIVSALSAVQLAILNKEMRFKRLMQLNAPSTIIGVTIGLLLGYNNYGVWSIVAMLLITQLVLSFLLWVTASWKPSFSFSMSKLKYHYNFGYKIMLSGLLDTIFTNSYNVIIGRFFPVQTLGYYERAKNFNDYPSVTMTGIIRKVTYPMLAQLQDDTPKLSIIYRRMLRITFFITAPLMMGAAALAYPLFDLVLGKQWIPAVPYFQILSISAMLYPIHAFNINVLQVYGRSDLYLKLEIIKKIIIALSIVVSFQFGVMGLVWGSVVTSFISLLINTHYSGMLIEYSTKRQLMDMYPILIIAGMTFVVMYNTIILFKDFNIGFQLFASTMIGVLFYLLVQYFFKSGPMLDLLLIFKNRKL